MSIVLFALFLSCMGCCCGRIPLFGIWPNVDEAKIAAQLRRAPIVVDHICRADFVCERVTEVDVLHAYPVGVGPLSGQLTVLVDAEVRCEGYWQSSNAKEILSCAGTLGAIYAAAGVATWTLDSVTESEFGIESKGERLELIEPRESGGGLFGSGGGSWDD